VKKDYDGENTPQQDEAEQGPEHKSKSQRKRDMLALQNLGAELTKLPTDQFEKISLPDDLHDAVVEARRIHQHGAHKRQLQFIGRLMRDIDASPIAEQLATLRGQSARAAQELHLIEHWRDRLLAEGDAALGELVQEQPQADRHHVRQLLRNAHKEKQANKPPKSARALFHYLRELMLAE
jgi:ribosome-associated protein